MATCLVSGTLYDPSETAISGATVHFNVQSPVLNVSANALLGPKELSTTTASDGSWSLTISQGCTGIVTIDCPPDSVNGTQKYEFSVSVPATSTATFPAIWLDPNTTQPVTSPTQLPDGQIWIGNGANQPVAWTITGDASIAHTGVIILTAVGATGTYTKVTTDTKGRVTSGTTLSAGDIPTLNQNTTGTSSNVTGTVAIANGGTGQTSAGAAFNALSPMTTSGDLIYGGASGAGTRLGKGSDTQVLTLASGIPSWANPASGFANPMTTLGDIIYENATPAAARLAGNTTSTKNFLTQTGTGSVSAAPAWGSIALLDLPKRQVVIGSLQTTNVTRSGGYGSFSTPMTVAFTASFSGKYKVYIQSPGSGSNNSSGVSVKIVNTVGSATENYRGECAVETTIGNNDTNLYAFGIFTLASGTAYTFEAQGAVTFGTGFLSLSASSTALGVAVIAEQLE